MGGANFQGGSENLSFNHIFPENCMKMKEFGPGGGASVALPLRSATALVKVFNTSFLHKECWAANLIHLVLNL